MIRKRRIGPVGVFVWGVLFVAAPVSIGAPRRRMRGRRRRTWPPTSTRRAPTPARCPSKCAKARGCRSTSRPTARRCVFDLLGDLYTLPIAGGNGTAADPRTGATTTTRASRPTARRSRSRATAAAWRTSGSMDADGKNPRALTPEKDAYVRSAAWTPDGDYLVARKEDGEARRHPAGRAVDVPPRRRRRHQADLLGRHQQRLGPGRLAATAASSTSPRARARFNYIPDLSQRPLADLRGYDRPTGETLPADERLRRRRAAGALAGRQDARLRQPPRRRHRAGRARPRHRRRSASWRAASRATSRRASRRWTSGPATRSRPDGQALVFSNHGKLTRLELASARAHARSRSPRGVEQWRRAARRLAGEGARPARSRRASCAGRASPPTGSSIAFEAFGRVWLQELAAGKADGRAAPPDRGCGRARRRASTRPPSRRTASWIAYVTWSDAEGGARLEGARRRRRRRRRRAADRAGRATTRTRRGRRTGDRLVVIRGSGLEFRGPAAGGGGVLRDPLARRRRRRARSYVTTVKLADTLKFHPQAFWSADGTRLYFRDPIEPKKPTDPTRRTTSSPSGWTARTRSRTCGSRPSATSSPRPTGSGSPSRRATTST